MRTCNLPVTSDQWPGEERGGQMAGSEAECMQGVSPPSISRDDTQHQQSQDENYIDVFMSRNLAEVWPELKSIVWAVSYVCLHPNEFKLLSQIRLDCNVYLNYLLILLTLPALTFSGCTKMPRTHKPEVRWNDNPLLGKSDILPSTSHQAF